MSDVKEYHHHKDMLAIPAEEISDRTSIVSAPKVSVILMTRNHEDYFRQSIDSILNQKCNFDFEILIAEDFSEDRTLEICKEVQAENPQIVRLIHAHKNVGITANFLRVVARCRGDYVAILEGDDYWIDTLKLQKQANLLDKHPDYSWSGARTANRTFSVTPKKYFTLEDTLRRYIVHTSTVMFRTEHFKTYPRFPDIPGWESMVFSYLGSKGYCGFLDEIVSYYRHHDGGVWTGASLKERHGWTVTCTDAMNVYFEGKHQEELVDREIWIHKLHLSSLLDCWDWSQWRMLVIQMPEEWQRCMRTQPLQTARLSVGVLFAPLAKLFRQSRRMLGLRTRLRKFLETS